MLRNSPHLVLISFHSCFAWYQALRQFWWFYIQFDFGRKLDLLDILEGHRLTTQEPTARLWDVLEEKSPGAHALQVRHGNVKQALKLLGHAEIFNDEFRLFVKVAVNVQGFLCIDMWRFKIIFQVRKMNLMEYDCLQEYPEHLRRLHFLPGKELINPWQAFAKPW